MLFLKGISRVLYREPWMRVAKGKNADGLAAQINLYRGSTNIDDGCHGLHLQIQN